MIEACSTIGLAIIGALLLLVRKLTTIELKLDAVGTALRDHLSAEVE